MTTAIQSTNKLLLEEEFQYYLDHQVDLSNKYPGKVLVIKGKTILGVFDDNLTAYNTTIKEHQVGSFLIQLCNSGNQAYTATYHSAIF
ncbi:MAG: hypothetical protein Q7T20_16360 [Saprospiraceae bacterium]|nr:hypothetical protein [Saprospiraceae bacterium]